MGPVAIEYRLTVRVYLTLENDFIPGPLKTQVKPSDPGEERGHRGPPDIVHRSLLRGECGSPCGSLQILVSEPLADQATEDVAHLVHGVERPDVVPASELVDVPL